MFCLLVLVYFCLAFSHHHVFILLYQALTGKRRNVSISACMLSVPSTLKESLLVLQRSETVLRKDAASALWLRARLGVVRWSRRGGRRGDVSSRCGASKYGIGSGGALRECNDIAD